MEDVERFWFSIEFHTFPEGQPFLFLLSIHISNYFFKHKLTEIDYHSSFLFESPARSLTLSISRSDKAGKLLAEVLQKGLQGNR